MSAPHYLEYDVLFNGNKISSFDLDVDLDNPVEIFEEVLRGKFEMSKLFQTANKTVGDITYKNFGGYFIDDTPYYYMNGAFAMFKELHK